MTTTTAPPPIPRGLLSRREAAARLGVGLRTLDIMLADKTLPRMKLGARVLIDPRDIDRLVERGKRKPIAITGSEGAA